MELPSQFTEISFNSNIKNKTIRNIKMTEIEVNYSFAISSMWFSAKLKHLNKYKIDLESLHNNIPKSSSHREGSVEVNTFYF